jgi:hypothetical protein
MSANRYLPAARSAAQTIVGILAQHQLEPHISRIVLTETKWGAAWLFVVLDLSYPIYVEDYANSDVLHDLSAGLFGHPVVVSTSDGFRYAVLLSPSPNLRGTIPAFQLN